MRKNLVLILKSSCEFIRHTEDECKKNAKVLNQFFETISNFYIPLLNMFEKLETSNVYCKLGLVFSPVVCALLEDSTIHELYIDWLDKRCELGRKELERCKDNSEILHQVQLQLDKNRDLLFDFQEKYECNLIKKFSEYQQKGFIEILATCGTDVYLPHYMDMKEIVSAQIETGLQAYRRYFGAVPEGFWIPEMGYYPGLEGLIRAYGYSYTVLDSRSVILSETCPTNGIFYPSRTLNSLVVFTSNFKVDEFLYGEKGIVHNPVYRNVNRDIGFDLESEDLASVFENGDVRLSTGYKYWSKATSNQPDVIYNEFNAANCVENDAKSFLKDACDLLDQASCLVKEEYVTLVNTIDVEKMMQVWDEGVDWVEQIIRNASSYSLNMATCDEMLENQYSLEKIKPCYSSSAGAGYGENFLSNKNSWMIRYIRKACERMIDLADRFPTDTGLKTRLLNIGAKELLLAQSSGLAKMIDNDDSPDFAQRRFKDSIIAFTMVFDALGSNTVSTEWLTKLESKESIFPWMNYRIFSKKV